MPAARCQRCMGIPPSTLVSVPEGRGVEDEEEGVPLPGKGRRGKKGPVPWLPCTPGPILQAEHELRLTQTEFDRQAEVTRLLLEGISSTHVSLPGALGRGLRGTLSRCSAVSYTH